MKRSSGALSKKQAIPTGNAPQKYLPVKKKQAGIFSDPFKSKVMKRRKE